MRCRRRDFTPALIGVAALLGCAAPAVEAASGRAEIEPAEDVAPIEPLPEDLAPRVAAQVEHFGHNWPSFRFHGAVLVARGDEIGMLRAFGDARIAEGVPNTPHTRFRLGTLGAPITAATVLALVDEGHLSLADPVSRYLPAFPRGDEITIEHLLAHRSGIESFTGLVMFRAWKGSAHTVDETLELVKTCRSEGPSDDEITPSNSNYVVLGAIVERVGGEPFGEVAKRLVLRPAGMIATTWGDGDVAPALGMQWSDDEALDVVAHVDPTAWGPAGGFVSTVEDMHRLLLALHRGALLSEESRALLFGRTPDDPGFGFVPDVVAGRRVLKWAGGLDGSTGAIEHATADGTTIVVLANGEVVPPTAIVEAVDDAIAGLDPRAWEEPRAAPVALAEQLPFVGQYVMTERSLAQLRQWADPEEVDRMLRVRIAQEEDHLVLVVPGHGRRRMHPTSARSFFFKDVSRTTAEVARTADGTRRLALRQGGGPEIRFVSLPSPAGTTRTAQLGPATTQPPRPGLVMAQ